MGKFKIVLATLGSVVVVVSVVFGATAWATIGRAPAPPVAPPGFAVPNTHSLRPPKRAETTFVPIAPCRIVATAVAGGKVGNGVTRSYLVGGATGFPAQGGKANGCGIPVGADAISATLTAAQSSAAGYLRAWPANETEPVATTMSYVATSGATTSGVTVKIRNDVALALKVRNYGGPTNVNIDVTGYYSEQMEGMISPSGPVHVYAGSNRILSAEVVSTGQYQVDFDHDISNCSVMIDTYNVYVYGSAYTFNGTHVAVYTWRLDSTTHAEVAESDYFYITVTC